VGVGGIARRGGKKAELRKRKKKDEFKQTVNVYPEKSCRSSKRLGKRRDGASSSKETGEKLDR